MSRLSRRAFLAGYGDITALIELAGRTTGEVPLAVYTVFNITLTIVVDANGPSQSPPRPQRSCRAEAHSVIS